MNIKSIRQMYKIEDIKKIIITTDMSDEEIEEILCLLNKTMDTGS